MVLSQLTVCPYGEKLQGGSKIKDEDEETEMQVIILQVTDTKEDTPVEVRAASDAVVSKMLSRFLVPELVERVGPEQVADRAKSGRLLESVELKKKHGR